MNNLKNWLRRAVYSLKYHIDNLKLPNSPLILVYSKGKTGTTTVFDTIRGAGKNNVFQLHTLNEATISERKLSYRKTKALYPSAFINSLYLKRKLVGIMEAKKKIEIVTVVRDPLAITLSSFFQNKEKHYRRELSSVEILDVLRESEIENGKWFDSELLQQFGFNIFEKDFNKSAGYHIYENDNVRLLVVKLEMVNETLTQALSSFFAIEEMDLIKSNQMQDKSYRELYTTVKNNFRFKETELKEMYNTRYMNQFYSQSEIQVFIDNWLETEKR